MIKNAIGAIFALLLCATVHGQVGGMLGSGKGDGRVNINLGSGMYPFVNFVKTCSSWRENSVNGSNGFDFPTYLTSDGYPWRSPPTSMSCTITTPVRSNYSGSWYIAWTGKFGTGSGSGGTAGVTIGSTLVNGAITIGVKHCADGTTDPVVSADSGTAVVSLTGTDCYVEFTPALNYSNGFQVVFRSSTATGSTSTIANITNIALCRSTDVGGAGSGAAATACLNSADDFSPSYLTYLRGLNPRALRFVQWTRTNGSNRSRYAYDTPVTAMSYTAERWYTDPSTSLGVWAGTLNFGVGGGCSGANAYCVAAPTNWEGLVQGSTIQVYIANNAVSNFPTLNVGGTGDIEIVNAYTQRVGPNITSSYNLQTFIYDATLNKWMYTQYGGFGLQNIGLTSSIPTRTLVKLCNLVRADCWINVPPLYSDAAMSQMAADVASRLLPYLKAYFEYSNETWDGSTNPVRYWCGNVGWTLGLASANPWNAQYDDSNFPSGDSIGYCTIRYRRLMAAAQSAWPAGNKPELRQVLADFIIRTEPGLYNRLLGTGLTLDSNDRFTTGSGSGASFTASWTAPSATISSVSVSSGSIVRGLAVSASGLAANTYVADFGNSGAVVGGISGTTLTISSGVYSDAGPGCRIGGTGVINNTTITAGTGPTFTVDKSQTVAGGTSITIQCYGNVWKIGNITLSQGTSGSRVGQAVTATAGGTGNAIATDYTSNGNRPGDYATDVSAASYVRGLSLNYQRSCYMQDTSCGSSYDPNYSVTGSISGTTLTISAGSYPLAGVGYGITGSGVTAGTIITGGSGPTFTVNNSQTVSAGTTLTLVGTRDVSLVDTSNPGVFHVASHGYNNGDRITTIWTSGTGLGSTMNGIFGTVTNKTTDTFELTNIYNSTGRTSISSDFTSKSWLGAGTGQCANAGGSNTKACVARLNANITVGLNATGLLTQADNYDSGVASSMETALQWIDDDYRAGAASNLSYFNKWSNNAVNWSAETGRSIKFVHYEGGFDPMPINEGTAGDGTDQGGSNYVNILGINSDYYRKIAKLLLAYRFHDKLRNTYQYVLDTMWSYPNTALLSQYEDIYSGWIGATMVGGISNGAGGAGTILNITNTGGRNIVIGMAVNGKDVNPSTVITDFIGGTGGTGTYRVNISQFVDSAASGAGLMMYTPFTGYVGQWALQAGDIYSTIPYATHHGSANFGAGR